MNDNNTQLAKISEFEAILATIDNLHDARRMLSLAQGLVTTACKEYIASERVIEVRDDRDRAYDTAVKAGELRLMAEAKLGELIIAERDAGRMARQSDNQFTSGIDNRESPYPNGRASLKDIGLSYKEGISATTIAKHKNLIPEVVAEAIANNDIPTRKALERKIANYSDKDRKSPDIKQSYDVGIRRGDFREVLTDIPDNSVKLILTDPPYGKQSLPLWNDLGIFAARVLRQDGILIAYSGQMYLPQVINALSESLDWWWLCGLIHEGTGNLTPLGQPVRKVINQFKPLLMFVPRGGGVDNVFRDLVQGTGSSKETHNWAQPVGEAAMIIKQYCANGDLVVDPFAGSGSIGQAAKELSIDFIGAEILNNG